MPRRKKKQSLSRQFGRILTGTLGVATFCAGIFFAARLGISMAMNRLPESETTPANAEEIEQRVTLGSDTTALFLANDPGSLRRFFARFPTPETRSVADTSDLAIRRITGQLEAVTLDRDRDAVKIRATSGPMAGATYWLHHSQLEIEAAAGADPIISPLPGDILSPQP